MSLMVHSPHVAQSRSSTNNDPLCLTAKLTGHSSVAIVKRLSIAHSICSAASEKPIVLVCLETGWKIDTLLCATTRTSESLPLDPLHLMNQITNLSRRELASLPDLRTQFWCSWPRCAVSSRSIHACLSDCCTVNCSCQYLARCVSSGPIRHTNPAHALAR